MGVYLFNGVLLEAFSRVWGFGVDWNRASGLKVSGRSRGAGTVFWGPNNEDPTI